MLVCITFIRLNCATRCAYSTHSKSSPLEFFHSKSSEEYSIGHGRCGGGGGTYLSRIDRQSLCVLLCFLLMPSASTYGQPSKKNRPFVVANISFCMSFLGTTNRVALNTTESRYRLNRSRASRAKRFRTISGAQMFCVSLWCSLISSAAASWFKSNQVWPFLTAKENLFCSRTCNSDSHLM